MSYAVHVFTTITFILFLQKLKCNPLPRVAQVVSGRVTVLNKKKTLGKDIEISNSIGRGFQEMISKDVKDRIERRQYELLNFIYYDRPLEMSPVREFWAKE